MNYTKKAVSRRFLTCLIIGIFVVVNSGVYYLVFRTVQLSGGSAARSEESVGPGKLKVSVLNIGQGDSILIQGPTGKTMLVDGGPDRTVLAALATELGPLQRHIDMLAETHPDSDHISGFKYVLKEYSISQFMTPGIPDGTAIFREIEKTVDDMPEVKRIVVRRGARIDLGGGAYADILYPDRDMSKETATNDGSTTMHLVYGNTSFMLVGDLPISVEDWLIALDDQDGELKADVLKAGHHGSKYSTGTSWLSALSPSMVAISVGKNNKYGHPSPETLDRITAQGSRVLETETFGTIDFTSDGKNITQKSNGL